ncbi:SIS domain-containing protein [Rathayibacter sp. VKM Ac-2760]|uniref:MurR/RpiR family transcriptional regulator n=1 Tax=Rathayibacter sp. VKM Ac-2760 TaxID=2609253 RepID=UPI001316A395|nr:SIS domain-containing protein [Rathayibacter sp. VKM Ac-2760]QHC58713.1 SIS domain-containing protein [Rathayibacter sp. VKM Ac-2760]
MSFRVVATSSTKTWTPVEDRVLRVLLTHADASLLPAAAVADLAGAHESTVIRLAQKLGYRGYTDLREDLRADETRSSGAESGASAGPADFGAREGRSVSLLASGVSAEDLRESASALHRSREVYLLAKNDDLPLRDLLAARVRRLGKTTHLLGSSAKDIAERMRNFDERSVLIAFSLRASSRYLAPVLAEVARRGGRSIVVTDVSGSPLQPPPDHLLRAPSRADTGADTDLVPMALCYLLIEEVRAADPMGYAETAAGIDDFARLLGGRSESS